MICDYSTKLGQLYLGHKGTFLFPNRQTIITNQAWVAEHILCLLCDSMRLTSILHNFLLVNSSVLGIFSNHWWQFYIHEKQVNWPFKVTFYSYWWKLLLALLIWNINTCHLSCVAMVNKDNNVKFRLVHWALQWLQTGTAALCRR